MLTTKMKSHQSFLITGNADNQKKSHESFLITGNADNQKQIS